MNEDGYSFERFVVTELQELKEEVTQIRESQVLIRIDIAGLKVRAGIWGALAGAIPAVIGVVTVVISNG